MTAAEADILSSVLGGRVWLLWLQMVVQEVGGCQRRGQLFGTLAMVAVVAAVVVVAGWMIIDESELRFCDLGRCGRPCSLVSCSGSCARLPQVRSGRLAALSARAWRAAHVHVRQRLRRGRCEERGRSRGRKRLSRVKKR